MCVNRFIDLKSKYLVKRQKFDFMFLEKDCSNYNFYLNSSVRLSDS